MITDAEFEHICIEAPGESRLPARRHVLLRPIDCSWADALEEAI